ncbi:MAG: MFS transporter [Bacteroidota bacterium]|jgi:ACS family hexuronate transporter-like MFS transporter|nr:MAG: MFS transporter [Bacteroidota bacterium]
MRTNYRWLIVALLFFATTINYIDRQIIGLLKPILEKEFAWSESDFAIIVVAFTAAYAAGLLSFGWFIDKVGTKMGYTISVVLWSLMGMLHAVARSVTGFVVARIGLGLGEAGNFPAGMKAISEWFPTKERGVAAGIFNSGTAVGVVLAVLITPWILVTFGWQEVFLITGASGFIWLVFWLWLYEIPARQKRLSPEELALIRQGQEEGEMKAKIPWIRLFAYPQTWAFLFGKFFIDPIFWFFLFWLPSYFASAFKLDLTRPSPELMIIYGATTLGSIYGGYLSSYMIRRGMAVIKARKTALLIFAVIELSILSAQFVTNIWVAVAIISLVVAVHQAWATNVFTLASDMFPREAVSSVVGIGGTAGAIGGMMFPILVGYLLDTYKAAENLPGGYNVLFTLCGVTYLVTWCIIHFLTRNRDRVEMS